VLESVPDQVSENNASWHYRQIDNVRFRVDLNVEILLYYVMPKVDIRPLAELFRANVLTMLKKEGLIDDSFIKMIMRWRHNSGVSVHNKVRIKPGGEQGMDNLAQYMIRNTFSLAKVRYNHA